MIKSIQNTICHLPDLIPKSDKLAVMDASKLKVLKRCPRNYFYRYYMGWELDGEAIHLNFGTCWHKAMEVIFAHEGKLDESVLEPAFDAFSKKYKELFEDRDAYDVRGIKTKEAAADLIAGYIAKYYGEEHETLHIEAAGSVPILMAPPRILYFNMDVITREDSGIMVWDHKTGSEVSDRWTNQWFLDPQMLLYVHALYCLYPPDQVFGAMINGAIFRKKGNEPLRVPLQKTPLEIERFLWDTNRWIDYLEIEHEALANCSVEDEVMQAFPCNEQSCSKWGRTCEYHDFCCSWPNPLKRIEEFYPDAPPGFVISEWDPRDKRAEAKEIIDIESE